MTTRESAANTVALNRLMWRWAIVLVVLGVFAVWATWRMTTATTRLPQLAGAAPAAEAQPQVEYWTCTMHPEVRESGPGQCSICSMDLVPKYAGSDELVPAYSQDLNNVPALQGRAKVLVTTAGHSLTPQDGVLLAGILNGGTPQGVPSRATGSGSTAAVGR